MSKISAFIIYLSDNLQCILEVQVLKLSRFKLDEISVHVLPPKGMQLMIFFIKKRMANEITRIRLVVLQPDRGGKAGIYL
jgi:hypothetical protein